MAETKFVKAFCSKARRYLALEVKQVGSEWRIVNVDDLAPEDAAVLATQVKQDHFETHDTVLACRKCGGRRLGGCACPPTLHECAPAMKYQFDCVYCKHLKVDYSVPSRSATAGRVGKTVTVQGKEVRVVTFSNVEWKKFDRIVSHTLGYGNGYPSEPRVHVVAEKEKIEFHGYNISAMDEGVYYDIGKEDDFSIECDVNTSTILPHPGGCLYITFGLINAEITQDGGSFQIDGQSVASVGSRFRMRLSLSEEGKYEVFIDGNRRGSKFQAVTGETRITFGFRHGAHNCNSLSHASLKDIKMAQGVGEQ